MIDNVNFYFTNLLLRQIKRNSLHKIEKAIVICHLHPHPLDVYVAQGAVVVFGQRLVQGVVGVSADQGLPLGEAGYYQGVIKVSGFVCKLYHVALKHPCGVGLNPVRTNASVL